MRRKSSKNHPGPKPSEATTTTVTVRLSPELKAQAEHVARTSGLSLSEIIRRTLQIATVPGQINDIQRTETVRHCAASLESYIDGLSTLAARLRDAGRGL